MNFGKFFSSTIDWILTAIEALIGLRVIFKLAGVSPTHTVVKWLYEVSNPLVDPFKGLFSASSPMKRSELELTALLAMLIYGIVGYIISDIIRSSVNSRRPY